MKAIIQDRYGSPADLRVADVAVPEIGPGQTLVRVRAASLHPDVWHMVMGRPFILRLMGGGFSRPKHPIPGTDMAGVVEAVGRDVTQFRPGDEVFGETAEANSWVNGGAFAEYVAVEERLLEPKPANVSFEQAASVPAAGFIALMNLPEDEWLDGAREVLVNGAGGGVGCLALQIAKSHGARVTAVDSTRKLALLHSLGADRVIDYTREDFTRDDQRYDLIFDVPGNHPYPVCRRVLKDEGRYVIIGHEHYGKSGHRIFGLIPLFLYLMLRARFDDRLGSGRGSLPDKRTVMLRLRELLESGEVTPVVDSIYPLEEVQEAFRHLTEDETLGKVILKP